MECALLFSSFIKLEHKSQRCSPSQSEQRGCGAVAIRGGGGPRGSPASHSLQAEFRRPVNPQNTYPSGLGYVAAPKNTRCHHHYCYDLASPGACFLLDALPALLPPGKEPLRQLVWPHFRSLPTPTQSTPDSGQTNSLRLNTHLPGLQAPGPGVSARLPSTTPSLASHDRLALGLFFSPEELRE